MTTSDFFWVIGGGLMQVPLVAEVRALGLGVLVTDRDPACACADLADRFEALDVFDIPGHLSLAEALVAQRVPIAGVLAAGIDAPETMAVLARRLGLPGVDPEIARLVHHKAQFRERMQQLGYPVPRFVSFGAADIDRLPELAKEIGYPLIIKNTDSSGSRGTRIFKAPDPQVMREVAEQAVAVSRSGRALMESCWEGSEHTLESLFDCEARFHRCFITDRHFDKQSGFALETGLRHPSVLDVRTQEEMYQLAERVAIDLGVRVGAAKFDFMVTPNGPRIIEMTVRLSGGFDCQYLVPAATGKAVLQAAVLTALGRPFAPGLLHDSLGRIGVSGSVWPEPGRIVSIEGVEAARQVPGVEQVILRHQPGDRVLPYEDCTRRVCFIVATGADEAGALGALHAAQSAIQIQTAVEA